MRSDIGGIIATEVAKINANEGIFATKRAMYLYFITLKVCTLPFNQLQF